MLLLALLRTTNKTLFNELSRVPRRGAVPAGSKVFFSNSG